jgi:phospholipid/cholesterol/gamma-HCH transport system permease protein
MVPLLVIFADGVGMLADFGINMHGVVFALSQRVRFFGIHRHQRQSKRSSLVFFIGMIGCYKGFNAETEQA